MLSGCDGRFTIEDSDGILWGYCGRGPFPVRCCADNCERLGK